MKTRYKMQTDHENLNSFFVWYVITCHLTTYRASRNRFSMISFHDYFISWYKMQTTDCGPDTKWRLGTKCRLQTAEWVQNAE